MTEGPAIGAMPERWRSITYVKNDLVSKAEFMKPTQASDEGVSVD